MGFKRVIFLFLVSFLCNEAFADKKIIPVLSDGDAYVAVELDVYDKNNHSFKRVIDANDRFIKLVKSAELSEILESYYRGDGSRLKIERKGGIKKQHKLYEEAESVDYGDFYVLDDYVLVTVIYGISGKKFAWRESYYCPKGEACKKSIIKVGQLFEYAYAEHRSGSKSKQYADSFDNVLGNSTPKTISSVKIPKVGKDKGGESVAEYRVGIVLQKIDSKLCNCVKQSFVNEGERRIVERFSKFFNELSTANLSSKKQRVKLFEKHVSGFDINKGVPVVSWRAGEPRFVHTNVEGYLMKLAEWPMGSPLYYMKDNGYIYLVLGYSVSGNDKPRFQIVILKESDGGYRVYPSGDRDLNTRQLVFRDDMFVLIREILASDIPGKIQ